MRDMILTIILIFLVLFLSINISDYLTKTAKDLIGQLNKLEKAVKLNDWTEAEKHIKSMQNKWKKSRPYLSVLIEDDEMLELELSMRHLSSYIKSYQKTEAMKEISGLKFFLKDIPEKEKLTFKTVF